MQIADEEATKALIEKIRKRDPQSIKFDINNSTVKSVHHNLKTGDFTQILYLYGHPFLLQVLRICEEKELYICCTEIKRCIELHNKMNNENLTTTWR